MMLTERSMKVHLSRFYEMIRYTYLYDTGSYMGIGYIDFEGDLYNIFGKTMVG